MTELHDFSFPIVVFASALIVHLVFRHWEPLNPIITLPLLVLVPALLSVANKSNCTILSRVGISFSSFYSALLVSIGAYRLAPFHPLAAHPGPLLCRISKLYMVWIVQGGKRHIYIQNLHYRYGDVVRIGPNKISICNVSALIPILGYGGLPKGPSWDGRGMYQEIPSLPNCRNPHYHAQRRKPWNRAFGGPALKEYQQFLQKRASQFVEGLAKQRGAVDLAQWLSFFTYDFMGDMIYGGGTELMQEGDKDGLWRLIKDGLDVSIMFDTVPWLSYYLKRLPGIGKDLKRLHDMAFGRTRSRYRYGSSLKDVFYYLSNEDGVEAQSPSEAVIVSDGLVAVVAGSDTTAGVMSNVFYLLLCNPEKYRRLETEVNKFYPPEEDSLSPKHHTEMAYLEAVLNETMRLFPAISSGSQRAPAPGKGGQMIGPYFVPGGTQVRLHTYSMQRDPRYFTNPETFWPERWLIAAGHPEYQYAGTEKFKHNSDAFIPFSFGPHHCAGKNLAMQEMRTVMCHLVRTLRVSREPGWEPRHWEDQLEDKFALKFGRLPVRLELR